MNPARTLIVFVAGFVGCHVGPSEPSPEIAVPTQWGEAADPKLAAAPPERWWEVFGDPILDSLVQRAVTANLDLAIAQARVLEARALRDFAAGQRLPELDARAGYSRSQASSNTRQGLLSGTSPQDLYEVGFDARWEIDLFGSNRSALEAARAGLEAAEEGRRDALVTLLGEVAREYVELRGLQRQIVLTRANADAQRETLELTRARAEAGLATQLDVSRAETLNATTEAAIPSFQAQVSAAVHRLSVLIGEPPSHLADELEESGGAPRAALAAGELAAGVPSDLLRRRPDIRQAERELAQAAALTAQATADLYPKLTLGASIGHESASFSDLADANSLAWSITPSLFAPLFAGGSLRAAVRVQDARQEQALLRYQQVVLEALAEVEDALTAFARERERQSSLQVALASSRRALELANDLHAQGLADFFEVLDTQRAQLLTELEFTRSETVLAAQAVALYKALGGGWESLGPSDSAAGANP